MNKILKKRLLILLVICSSISMMVIQLYRYSTDASLNDWNEGINGYIQASRLQQETDKPIFLFFYTDWCSNCRSLRENILSNSEVKHFLDRVIPIKINPETGVMEDQLSKEFGVQGYPTLFLVSASQQIIAINGVSHITPSQFIKKMESGLVALGK